MKLHIQLVVLLAVQVAVGDIVESKKALSLTNNSPRLQFDTPNDTNSINAESLGTLMEDIQQDGKKLLEQLDDSFSQFSNIFETADKLQAMFVGATNMLEFVYGVGSNSVTVAIVNPYFSATREGELRGRFHILYPEDWRVKELSYNPPKKGTAQFRQCFISHKVGFINQIWHLDLTCPFEGMTPVERKKATKEMEIFTHIPLEKITFEPGPNPPVWIADYGTADAEDAKHDSK